MFEQKERKNSDPDDSQSLRNAVGSILIFIGVITSCGILWQIYILFANPEYLTPFKPLVSNHLVIGEIIIPSDILSCSIPLILLFLAIITANSFIGTGVNLLQGSLYKLVKQRSLELSDELFKKIIVLDDKLELGLSKVDDKLDQLTKKVDEYR